MQLNVETIAQRHAGNVLIKEAIIVLPTRNSLPIKTKSQNQWTENKAFLMHRQCLGEQQKRKSKNSKQMLSLIFNNY